MSLRLSELQGAGRSVEALRNLFDRSAGELPCLRRPDPEVDPAPELTGNDAIIANLSLLEKLAMLKMASTMSRGIARRVSALADCQTAPSWTDYSTLSHLGLCAKDDASGYHELTDKGRNLAPFVLQHLCRQYDVHEIVARGQGADASYACCCGGWSFSTTGHGRHQFNRARQSFFRHVPALCEAESA